jgi:hypothetical protein
MPDIQKTKGNESFHFKAHAPEELNLMIHFLHIGKCAGTTIKLLIQSINQNMQTPLIVAHKHKVRLADLPLGSRYFFSTRNPITRFYSGFYSRKRMGQPRMHVPWSEAEQKAFEQFPEANDLAEAIFSDSLTGEQARCAMQSIKHVGQHQHEWFSDIEEVFATRPPLCILRQEHLAEDVLFLKSALNLSFDFTLETDSVRAHKNDYSNVPPLSELARANLEKWYGADIRFYAEATAWIEENQK